MGKGQDDFQVEDYGRRLATHQSAGRATLILPDGIQWWKPKKVDKASHNIEIIPYRVTDNIKRFLASYAKPGRWYPERTYYTHRNVGVNNEQYVCPAKTFGHPCPICEEAAKLKQFPDKESQDRAKGMFPSERQLFLVYDLDEPKLGLQLWDVATFNFGKQLDSYIAGARPKQQETFRRFYHRTEGSTLRLVVEEKKMPRGVNHVYHVHEMYEREQEVPVNLYDHGFDLDAMIRETDYDTLKKIYLGLADDVDDSPADEAPPRRNPASERESVGRNGSQHHDDAPEPPAKPVNRVQTQTKPEPKKEPVKFGTGDVVSFERRGEELKGTIKKVDLERETASIEVEGFERFLTYDFSDLTMVRSDTTFDLPKDDDDPPAKTGKNSKWNDDDDKDEQPAKRGPGRPPGSKNRT